MKDRHGLWIGAAEAAQLLGVTRATLYAYVSRGHVRSQATSGRSRARLYARDDIERLRRRADERRDPGKAAAHALEWGTPVLASAIALIDGERLFYRGHDAVRLARERSVREVASLIWTGRFDALANDVLLANDRAVIDPRVAEAPAARAGRSSVQRRRRPGGSASPAPFIARAQAALVRVSTEDPSAYDLRPARVAACGWRMLEVMTAVATGGQRAGIVAIDERLARAWRVRGGGVDLLRAALVLCADHELNVSSFTARCVASAGSGPYAVVLAGLAALEGARHGGASARAESMLASLARTPRIARELAARARRGEPVHGFGHPLYPAGDPRASALLAWLREHSGRSPAWTFTRRCVQGAEATTGERPNLDFALAAVAHVLRLPPGAPLTLFAIGRTIGWIGHAIEQYATGQLIRPRARYVGVPPIVADSER